MLYIQRDDYKHNSIVWYLNRSSPSTAITWSALGCSSNPSHNVSAHTSAAAAASKAASNTGRRPYISTKPKSPRISTQVTNRRRIYDMNKTVATWLPNEVNYWDIMLFIELLNLSFFRFRVSNSTSLNPTYIDRGISRLVRCILRWRHEQL